MQSAYLERRTIFNADSSRRRVAFALFFGGIAALPFFAFLQGCSSVPEVAPVTVEERIQHDNTQGLGLAGDFEKGLVFKKDPVVLSYLLKLTKELCETTPELKGTPVKIFVIQDQDGVWKNFALPGNRIYLSAAWLRELHFENELAAVISLELGHILNRSVIGRLELGKRGFGEGGVFSFSDESMLQALESAVRILYRAGYDPRGLSTLWSSLKPEVNSPYRADLLKKFSERTHAEIAKYTPLMNPIVRSKEFIEAQKRIKTL